MTLSSLPYLAHKPNPFLPVTLHGLQGLEQYLMTRIHHKMFTVMRPNYERDWALSLRMGAISSLRA